MPVKAKPYRHQKEAFQFVCFLFGLMDGIVRSTGAALLMEMGCGKTLVAIAVGSILYQMGLIDRMLVVAPLSLLGVWEEELRKFAGVPTHTVVLKGTLFQKKQMLEKQKPDVLNVVIVNYESAWRMQKELILSHPDLIVADEGHKIKSGTTHQSKGLHMIGDCAKYKLLLTGTLITNKEIDVWSQYRFANPSVFGRSFYAFRNHYFEMTGYGLHTPVFRKTVTEEFLKRLHSIAYRVTKEEALDLPEITEEIRYVELEPKPRKLYQEIVKESYAELSGSEISAVNVLSRILRLMQVTGGHVGDDDRNIHKVSNAKMEALEDVLDAIMADGKKLVVMARFIPELEDIEGLLEKRKIGFARIRGGIKDRSEEIRRFQEEDDCKVFVGQIAAAGLGLTLTAADTMVFYSMDYSMSNFIQAKARIHRIGAKGTCHYIYLLTRHTIDEKVMQAVKGKIDLAKALVDDYRNGKNPYETGGYGDDGTKRDF